MMLIYQKYLFNIINDELNFVNNKLLKPFTINALEYILYKNKLEQFLVVIKLKRNKKNKIIKIDK